MCSSQTSEQPAAHALIPLPPFVSAQAHRITLFKMDINRFGHRREIARIVSGIQEAAMTLSEEGNEQYQNKRGNGGVGGAGGRVVSLRALLGEPPYGTV